MQLGVLRRRVELLLERGAGRVAVGGGTPPVALDLVHARERQAPAPRVAIEARRA